MKKILDKNKEKKISFFQNEYERYYLKGDKKITNSVSKLVGDDFDFDLIDDIDWYIAMGLDFHLMVEKEITEKDLKIKSNLKFDKIIKENKEKIIKSYKIKDFWQELIVEQENVIGRFDFLGQDENGNFILIDFKTSNILTEAHRKQISVYKYILEKEYNIKIQKTINIKIDKKSGNFELKEQIPISLSIWDGEIYF